MHGDRGPLITLVWIKAGLTILEGMVKSCKMLKITNTSERFWHVNVLEWTKKWTTSRQMVDMFFLFLFTLCTLLATKSSRYTKKLKNTRFFLWASSATPHPHGYSLVLQHKTIVLKIYNILVCCWHALNISNNANYQHPRYIPLDLLSLSWSTTDLVLTPSPIPTSKVGQHNQSQRMPCQLPLEQHIWKWFFALCLLKHRHKPTCPIYWWHVCNV